MFCICIRSTAIHDLDEERIEFAGRGTVVDRYMCLLGKQE